jgi:hypothetical protein
LVRRESPLGDIMTFPRSSAEAERLEVKIEEEKRLATN